MTVKINNEELYKVYEANKGMSSFGLAKEVWYFLDDVVKRNVFADADSIKKVVNAIFDGEDIELVEPKFRIRILRMNSNGGHQYVTSNINSTKRFACGEINQYVLSGTAIQEFTRSDF